eukprot:11197034-Lingulodinium_polyedra.AAC.1
MATSPAAPFRQGRCHGGLKARIIHRTSAGAVLGALGALGVLGVVGSRAGGSNCDPRRAVRGAVSRGGDAFRR